MVAVTLLAILVVVARSRRIAPVPHRVTLEKAPQGPGGTAPLPNQGRSEEARSKVVADGSVDAVGFPAELPPLFASVSHRLPNGVTVILVEDHNRPRVSTQIVFAAGSRFDPPGREGLAHLVEHLVFGGTARLGTLDHEAEQPYLDEVTELTADLLPSSADWVDSRMLSGRLSQAALRASEFAIADEYRRLMAAIGASDVNGFTGVDHVRFSSSVPANELRRWAVIEAERFTAPNAARAFLQERERVRDELTLRDSCVGSRADDMVRSALFGGTPGGHDTAGDAEAVAGLTVGDADDFLREHYGPESMAVVLVGDIEPATSLEVIASTFGRIRPTARVYSGRRPTVPPTPSRSLPPEMEIAVPGGRFLASWGLPGLSSDDIAAYRVVAHIVASYVERAVEGAGGLQGRVDEYSALSVLTVSGCPAARVGVATCSSALEEALRSLADRTVPQDRFADARMRVWMAEVLRLEEPDDLAAHLASNWALGRDPQALVLHLDALNGVDPAAAARAAEVLQAHDGFVVGTQGGREAPSDRGKRGRGAILDAALPEESSAFANSVLRMKVPAPEPRWLREGVDWTRTADDQVVSVYNPYHALFDLSLTWDVGTRDSAALCAAVHMWVARRRDWPPPAESLAGVDYVIRREDCGWASIRLGVRGPSSRFGAAVRRLHANLREPVIHRGTEVAVYPMHLVAQHLGERTWLRALYPPSVLGQSLGFSTPLPAEDELRSAVRLLAANAPRVAYTGPLEAAEVATHFPARPAPAPPRWVPTTPGVRRVQLRRGGPKVRAVRGLGRHGVELEGLYALYEAWVAGPDGPLRPLLARHGLYGWSAEVVRGDGVVEPTLRLEVAAPGRDAPGLADLTRDLEEAIALDDLDVAAWRRLVDGTRASLGADVPHFRDAPLSLADAIRRGIEDDPRHHAARLVSDVTHAQFRDFLRAVAAAHVTYIVNMNADPSSAGQAFHALGVVEVVE